MTEETKDPALAVPCPSCNAPADVPCYGSFGTHGDRVDHADLRSVERGTCALCRSLLVRGHRPGTPTDVITVWHPAPTDQGCPPLPDPSTEWDAYATRINLGYGPGLPGPENYLPDADRWPDDAVLALIATPVPVEPVRQVWCPECTAGKCVNCDGAALDPVTDQIVPCTCTHERTP